MLRCPRSGCSELRDGDLAPSWSASKGGPWAYLNSFTEIDEPPYSGYVSSLVQSPSSSAAATPHLPVRQDWLERRLEAIIKPDLPIVDPQPSSGRPAPRLAAVCCPSCSLTPAAGTTSPQPSISKGSRCIAHRARSSCVRLRSSSPMVWATMAATGTYGNTWV